MSPRMPAVPKETLWKLFKILLHQNYDNWIYSTRLYLITFNCFYAKKAIPGLFFLYFRLFNTVDSKQMFNKFCRWLDSNRGPLVLEATALPTEPQPLLLHLIVFTKLI